MIWSHKCEPFFYFNFCLPQITRQFLKCFTDFYWCLATGSDSYGMWKPVKIHCALYDYCIFYVIYVMCSHVHESEQWTIWGNNFKQFSKWKLLNKPLFTARISTCDWKKDSCCRKPNNRTFNLSVRKKKSCCMLAGHILCTCVFCDDRKMELGISDSNTWRQCNNK